MSRYACPECGSDNTRKLSLIHAEGTTRVAGRTGNAGIGVSSGGGVGVGVARGSYAGVNVTDLSASAAPPARRQMNGAMWGMVIVGILVYFSFSGTSGTTRMIAALVAASFAGYFMTKGDRRWNREELPRATAEWERSLQCQRCGEVFAGPG